ncbi:MAG: M23 family metallopeptidase [Alphaproteobacteria bacterium]|nr:M23 family metallopeptidase [Alphaproteobacteria bacterium]
MRLYLTVAFLMALWSPPGFSGELLFQGDLEQGALVLAVAAPGALVLVNGRAVQVDDTGGFMFGLGRDHSPTLVIDVRFIDGTATRRTLTVRQRRYPEQHIDNLSRKMVTPPAEVRERIAREAGAVRDARAHASNATHIRSGLIWPIFGPVTGIYGSRRILNGEPRAPHYGIDIAAPLGAPVQTMAAGMVRLADELYLSGNTVIVDHGHGITSSYLHMQDISVRENQRISQGHVIGHVGATGRTSGPHLDWRINWFEVRLDPELVAGPQMTGNSTN